MTASRRPTRAFLFDVDGTLIRAGGAGKDAFVAAWQQVFPQPHAFDAFRFDGCTDPGILADGARAALGRDATPAETEAFFATYLDLLPRIIDGAERYRVLPGIPQVLEGLAARPDCVLGLCTGNLEAGARVKLERGGLNRFFAFGGFGSDSMDRAALTRVAWRRAEAMAGGPVEAWVIGDSPRDYAAAKANGLPVALVATGGTDPAALAALRPDLLFPSFEDWEAGLARLLGLGDGLRCGSRDVARAARVVREGGVLVYPTETLYGLGGDGLDPAPAMRIRSIKGARETPFLLLCADADAAFSLAAQVPDTARVLADAFWPGPLTMVLPARPGLPDTVVGRHGTVAVRVDSNPFCRALCRAIEGPLLSTSANRTGQPPPSRSQDVEPFVVGASDLFVTRRRPLVGRPSTLVAVTGAVVDMLRPGAVPEGAIRAAVELRVPGGGL